MDQHFQQQSVYKQRNKLSKMHL